MELRARAAAAELKPLLHRSHLVTVARAAGTATAAWLVGQMLPGDLADYAYYAPLGVLIAMTPTVAASFSAGVKAVFGVLLGLGVAWLLILIGVWGALALFLAIGIATFITGLSWLGPGRDYIPFAAAFVFLSGSSDPAEFSAGLALQFTLGAVLGVLANLVLPPPLATKSVRALIIDARESVANCATAFTECLAPDSDAEQRFLELSDQASTRIQGAQEWLAHAQNNRSANLLARIENPDLRNEERELSILAQVARELRLVSDPSQQMPSSALKGQGKDAAVPAELRDLLVQAGDEVSNIIRSGALVAAPPSLAAERVYQALNHANELVSTWSFPTVVARERVYLIMHALRRITSHIEG